MKIFSCILLSLLIPYVLEAQPKLSVIGGKSFDFGNIYTGLTVKKLITIKNEGNETLSITNVSSSCGCTAALMSNGNIKPGDSASLSISFDSHKFSGKVSKSVSFETNDPAEKKSRVVFTANVIKLLTIEPEYLVFKGVPIDSSSSQHIVLRNTGTEAIRFLSVTSSDQSVTASVRSMTLSPNDSTFLELTFKPRSTVAAKGTVTIATDHQNIGTLSVRFFGLALAPPASKTHRN